MRSAPYAEMMSRLIQQEGATRAEARARSGEIWGQTIANLAPNLFQGYAQLQGRRDAQADRAAAAEDRAFTRERLTQQDARADRVEDRQVALMLAQMTSEEKQQALADMELKARVFSGVTDQTTYDAALTDLQGMGVDTAKMQPAFNPGFTRALAMRSAQIAKEIRESEKPDQVTVSPGQTVMDRRTGQPVFSVPYRPKEFQVTVPGANGQPESRLVTDEALRQGVPAYRAPERQRDLTPNQALAMTRSLRNDFVKESSAARTVQTQYEQMRASLQAVRGGAAPAGSQGVLVTFQKILDPTSVVRESEYARSASGLSLLGRLEGQWMKIREGGAGVRVEDLDQFVTLAEQFARNQARHAADTKTQIDAIASEYGLRPELITRDIEIAAPASAAGAGTAASAPGTIRARDPQGNIHQAPVGTALPAGWVQVP